MTTIVLRPWNKLSPLVRKAGPYLLLELLMPGGTLLALLLFLSQRADVPAFLAARPATAAIASALGAFGEGWRVIASVWHGRHRERDGLEALAFAP